MPTTAAKRPQDRKPKARKPKAEDVPLCFTFEHDGESYSFRETDSVVTPGWVRLNRNAAEHNVVYGLIEQLADEKTLDVLDHMTFEQHGEVLKAFGEYLNAFLGVSLGESLAF